MRPGEVLDAQADLITRLEDPTFHQYIDVWAAPDGDPKGVDFHSLLRNHVKAGHAYRVTHDMSQMVEFAASQLEDLDRFDLSLAPTGCGIVCFDRPLPVKDVRGRTMLIHWLIWGPAQVRASLASPVLSGTALWTFNDYWREPDDVAQELAAKEHSARDVFLHKVGRWAGVGMDVAFPEQRMGPAWIEPSETKRAEILAEGGIPSAATSVNRYVMALWMLLNQTVTKVEDESIDRPARRRAVKAKLPPKVTVIRLRREESHYEPRDGESLVEWHHRWIVRGHWRWQACGAGRTERKRIWIAPFIKGPESAPIKQSEKVYSLDR